MFKLPDNWRSLTDSELADLMVAGTAAATTALSDGDGEAMLSIQRDLEALQSEMAERRRTEKALGALSDDIDAKVAEAVKQAVSELATAVAEADVEDEGDVDDEETFEEATDVADEADADESDDPEGSVNDDVTDEVEGDEVEDEGAPAELSEGDTKLPAAPKKGEGKFALAQDVGSFKRGDRVSEEDLAEVMHVIARDLPLESAHVPVVHLDYSAANPTMTNDPEENAETLKELLGRGGMDLESFVAAGGWGTPSQIDYGFQELEGPVEELNLPTFNVNRGGLMFLDPTDQPYLADFLGTDGYWDWTEANDIAATADNPSTTKTKLRFPTPTNWNDVRLMAKGMWFEDGNLIERSWPERTRRVMRLAVLGHGHTINDWRVATVRNVANDVAFTYPASGAISNDGYTSALLEALDYAVAYWRDKYRMSRNATFEAVFPISVLPRIRADLSRRTGVDSWLNVSDQFITSLFASRGVRAQFPHGYDMMTDADGPWPANVKFMLYPSGTFGEGRGGSLTLGVFRSESQVEVNDHTAIWTEDFLNIWQFGKLAIEVTVAGTVSGKTGSAGL